MEDNALKGRKVHPKPLTGKETAAELLESAYPAFVGRDLRNAVFLMERSLRERAQVFLTLSGAMSPAGLHMSCIIPLIEAGFVSCLTTTGANLYHDLHRVLGDAVHEVNPHGGDIAYRNESVIRIYDLGFDEQALFNADRWFSETILQEDFQRPMGVAELHWLLGREVGRLKEKTGVTTPSLLETCHKHDVPILVGAPQDGSIFLAIAALAATHGEAFKFGHDGLRDILDMTGLQLLCHQEGKTAIWILGGGVPKNFTLQGEPMVCQFLGQEMQGFDFDIQFCVDVVDNGALSSCPAGEAHTWGKTSAECLEQNSVYCRTDVTVAAPLATSALLSKPELRREPPRLYRRLNEARQRVAAIAQQA